MTAMYLSDFTEIADTARKSGFGFAAFQQNQLVSDLGWPADVLEQWLFDHAHYDGFLNDYGTIDLARIRWELEAISAEELAQMPTGPSDRGAIEAYAAHPKHYINNRVGDIHAGVSLCWETHGTWKRWPVLIDRMLLTPATLGLQVVEGRTRVGVLKGLMREGGYVAKRHLAWVGRAAS